jgi:hypothetical protein
MELFITAEQRERMLRSKNEAARRLQLKVVAEKSGPPPFEIEPMAVTGATSNQAATFSEEQRRTIDNKRTEALLKLQQKSAPKSAPVLLTALPVPTTKSPDDKIARLAALELRSGKSPILKAQDSEMLSCAITNPEQHATARVGAVTSTGLGNASVASFSFSDGPDQRSRIEQNRLAAMARREASVSGNERHPQKQQFSVGAASVPDIERQLPKRQLPFAVKSPAMEVPCEAKRRRVLPPSITGDLGDSLPTINFVAELTYARTHGEVDEAARRLSRASVLGFDIEWRVLFQTGVAPRKAATIQLCIEDYCAIFHLFHLGPAPWPESLVTLLANASIKKVGVGASRDALKLRDDHGLVVASVVNCEEVARGKLGGQGGSLQDMTAQLLGKLLEKPARVRMSNWEANPLSPEQLDYAALDAYASLRVYEALERLPDMAAPPPRALAPTVADLPAPPEGKLVPAVERPGRLAPAKQAVYDLWHVQGWSPQQVADTRQIQLATILCTWVFEVSRALT